MIKEIVQDENFLKEKCKPCFFNALSVIQNEVIVTDLFNTAMEHTKECLGLSANQVGHQKRIIIVKINGVFTPMVNPKILPIVSAGIKQWNEGCLSFPGKRTWVRRYKKIKVFYQLSTGLIQQKVLTGLEAVTVQHEIDHLNGILI